MSVRVGEEFVPVSEEASVQAKPEKKLDNSNSRTSKTDKM